MEAPEYRTNLAGGKFRPTEAQQITISLEPEDKLFLEREPTNPYDENAIMVKSGDILLGYVPKNVAAELSPWLDSGWVYDCICKGHMQPLMPMLHLVPIADSRVD